MNELNIINVMNEAMIKTLKNKNDNFEVNLKIRKYLIDDSCFFKLDKIMSYKILEAVGVNKIKLEETYNKLISKELFYDLVNKGKINIKDKNLKINYTLTDNVDVFKK